MTIAQHNMYKSSDESEDKFYPAKLQNKSDFIIDMKFPLLLFWALDDTVECVKKIREDKKSK